MLDYQNIVAEYNHDRNHKELLCDASVFRQITNFNES
jgi:hypothetical protein